MRRGKTRTLERIMDSQPSPKSWWRKVLDALLLTLLLGLVAYKIALPWAPLWVDFIVIIACIIVWLIATFWGARPQKSDTERPTS